MSFLLVLVLCASPVEVLDGYAAAMDALGQSRFAEAGSLLETESDPLLRQEGWSRVYLAAGDPTAGLRAAEVGLERSPRHLGLLFQACRASLWLSSGETGVRYAERILEVTEQSPELTPQLRQEWTRTAQGFQRQAEEIAARDRARRRAVTRARGSSVGILVGCLVVLVLLGRRR